MQIVTASDRPRKTTPPTAEYRMRVLMALSLLNHRATPEGLTPADVQAVKDALEGLV